MNHGGCLAQHVLESRGEALQYRFSSLHFMGVDNGL
jgi:hypothetical protein